MRWRRPSSKYRQVAASDRAVTSPRLGRHPFNDQWYHPVWNAVTSKDAAWPTCMYQWPSKLGCIWCFGVSVEDQRPMVRFEWHLQEEGLINGFTVSLERLLLTDPNFFPHHTSTLPPGEVQVFKGCRFWQLATCSAFRYTVCEISCG